MISNDDVILTEELHYFFYNHRSNPTSRNF